MCMHACNVILKCTAKCTATTQNAHIPKICCIAISYKRYFQGKNVHKTNKMDVIGVHTVFTIQQHFSHFRFVRIHYLHINQHLTNWLIHKYKSRSNKIPGKGLLRMTQVRLIGPSVHSIPKLDQIRILQKMCENIQSG